MATTEDSSDLWDASVRKSWADLVDEDSKEKPSCRKSWAELVDDESLSPRKPVNGVKSETSFKIPAVNAPFDEIANIGKADGRTSIPQVDSLPNFGKSLQAAPKTPVKVEPELPQEDISLTGHLDVKLGLVSPAKETRRVVAVKSTVPRSSPSKATKRKADSGAPRVKEEDPMTMPSPSKILRSTPKKGSAERAMTPPPAPRISCPSPTTMTPPSTMITRKRMRDMLTPTPSKDGKRREKREAETDPEVLARRQRQIDYGKNTLGYERYRQMIPKEAREKNHPKTPPIGIKFSRRAWDGLVKVWRQRLHFWDPPSEGGGDPQCLEVPSDMSDCYSDASLPNTPVQEMKRKRNERSHRYSAQRRPARSDVDDDDDDDDDGCTPLPD